MANTNLLAVSYAENIIPDSDTAHRVSNFENEAKMLLDEQTGISLTGAITAISYPIDVLQSYLSRAKALSSQQGFKNIVVFIRFAQYDNNSVVAVNRRNQTLPVIQAYGYKFDSRSTNVADDCFAIAGLGTLNFGTLYPPFVAPVANSL